MTDMGAYAELIALLQIVKDRFEEAHMAVLFVGEYVGTETVHGETSAWRSLVVTEESASGAKGAASAVFRAGPNASAGESLVAISVGIEEDVQSIRRLLEQAHNVVDDASGKCLAGVGRADEYIQYLLALGG